jgi:sialate O-acetylesterase
MLIRILPIFLLLLSPLASADIRLPRLISDGMVLQRDTRIPLWGWAEPGEQVQVRLNGKLVGQTQSDSEQWQITLPPQPPGGPHRIELNGNNRILFDDVYFGDVWVASGQSNMELPMARVAEAYPKDLQTADYPLIRQFNVPQRYNFKAPQNDVESGQWVVATPDTIAGFSAVAFYFARELFEHNGVPVGILNNALGGSPVEAWLSEEALQAFPEALAEAKRFKDDGLIRSITQADKTKNQQWYGQLHQNDPGLNGPVPWHDPALDDSNWQSSEVPGYRDEPFTGVWWLRKTLTLSKQQAENARILRLGRIVDADETYINGVKVGHTTYQYPPRRYAIPDGLLKAGDNLVAIRVTATNQRTGFIPDKPYWLGTDDDNLTLSGQWKMRDGTTAEPLEGDTFIRWKPLGLFNGLTAPLTRLPIKGVIWYQGESNASRWQDYHAKFTAMIRDWRRHWGQGDFPFLYVQLANFMQKKGAEPTDSDWARLREAQRRALSEPDTAMTVAIDTGEWNDIHPVDKKTLGRRLALAARAVALDEKVAYRGPQLQSVTRKGQQLQLSFIHATDGLVLKDGNAFAIAAADGEYQWARKLEKQGNKILLSHPDISKPVKVRYAWADNPDAVLYNGAGLPASPFQAEVKSNTSRIKQTL